MSDTQAETEALLRDGIAAGILNEDGTLTKDGARRLAEDHMRVNHFGISRAAQPKPEVAPDTRIKTTVVATYEDLRWQLHTIAGHLRGMNRWKEATRVQKISDSMWPKGDIIPQPMIPRSNHG